MQILFQKKFLIPGVIALAALGFFGYRSQANSTPELQFVEVKKSDISSTVTSSGTLTGKEVANLKFKSLGRMTFLNVKAGDKVSAFQTIAGLDTKLLETDLQQAQNTLRDKQAIAEKVEDDVKDHDKDESFKQKMDRTTAQVARDNAFDEVKSAQKALADAYLYTPIAGVVTQAPIIAGQNVTATDLIAQIVDIESIYFDTEVDEADIGKVKIGQKTKINLDAYPDQQLMGTVDQIIPQTKTSSSGATVVTVRMNLGTPQVSFVNGLSGQATIVLSEAKDVLIIPLDALREDETVIIQINNQLKSQKVVTGIKSDTDVEVKQGLNEGNKVLLNPPSNLKTRSASLFGGR